MTVTAPDITTTLASSAREGRGWVRGEGFEVSGFDTLLSRAEGAGATADQRERQIREAADEFVGMAFILPLMKMSRNDPFKSEMFHGGQGEEAFGAQLDQMRAKQVSPAISKPLVDAIYNRFRTQIQGMSATKGVDRHG